MLPPSPKAAGKRTAKATKVKPDGTTAARGLLEMVELFTVARFGTEAAFSLSERFFIEAPLARLIERYGNLADQFAGFIDPALLVAGVALYVVRLTSLASVAVPSEPPAAGNPDQSVPEPAQRSPTPAPVPSVDERINRLFGKAFES